MKKYIIFIFFFLFIMIPINVNAVSIRDTVVIGDDNGRIGDEISLDFVISFNGLSSSDPNGLGIAVITYELIFDDTVLVPINISSDSWDSIIKEENGSYFVVSQIKEDSPSENKCIDGVLHCSNYFANIKFIIKNTDKDNATVKMGNILAALLRMYNPDKPYTEDETVAVISSSYKNKLIKIERNPVAEEKTAVEEKPPVIEEKQKTVVKKSDNTNLGSIEIEGYEINFDKERKSYNIVVEKGINELKITAKTEDSKATYKIIGADNLLTNNYKATIEVTSESGKTTAYFINVKEKDVAIAPKSEKFEFKITKNQLIIGEIVLLSIVIIAIIIRLTVTRKDLALEKSLDEL